MLVLPPKIIASCWLAAMSTLVSPDDSEGILMAKNTMEISTSIIIGASSNNNLIASTPIITNNMQTYNLGNGSVTLPNPLQISVSKKPEILKLRDPTLLGSGGGGAVFGYSIVQPKEKPNNINNNLSDVAVKVSWSGSADSVRNECHVLQVLEERGVSSGVERCLASLDYPFDDSKNHRAMIVMEPVVAKSSASNIMDLPTPALRQTAVDQLMRIMLQMMAVGVVTTDVQPLISIETGSVLLIDMTEAKVLLLGGSPTPIDLALATSFVSEVWNLIPHDMTELASESLLSEWKLLLETKEKNPNTYLQWSPEMVEILQDQPLLSAEAADYIGRYTSSQK